MRKIQIRQITMGAMILALYGIVLGFDTLSAGFLITTIPFLLPIPFVLYTREFGFSSGMSVVLGAVFIGLFFAPFYQVILAIMYAIIGVVYGWGVRNDLNDKQLMFMTFGFVAIITLITTIIFGAIYGYNLIEELQDVIEISRSIVGDAVNRISENMFMFILMFSLLLMSILEAFVIHMLSTLTFLYMKLKPARKVRFRDIQYPMWLGILSAIAFLVMMAVQSKNLFPDHRMLISFLGTTGFLYLSFLGLLYFYKNPRFNKWAIYSIMIYIFTLTFYSPIHLGIGLFTSVSGVWRKSYE